MDEMLANIRAAGNDHSTQDLVADQRQKIGLGNRSGFALTACASGAMAGRAVGSVRL